MAESGRTDDLCSIPKSNGWGLPMLSVRTAAVFALLSAGVAGGAVAQSPREAEVVVTITKVRAIDKIDAFSRGDFFARVTIDGSVQAVPPVKQQGEIAPNWVFTQKVKRGRVPVRVEILDKDLTKDELIDINRVPDKRVQEFTVNTRSCTIAGFAGSPRCGDSITRAGDQPKAAEITFKVTVNK